MHILEGEILGCDTQVICLDKEVLNLYKKVVLVCPLNNWQPIQEKGHSV